MARPPYLDHPGPIAFAHRGGALEVPENTLAAFEHAVKLGYRYLETDIRVTADGVVIAFHDETLDRVADRSGLVAGTMWAEVAAARVTGETIPKIEDVLGTWPDVRVNIDVKDERGVAALVDVLRRTRAHDRVCVGAFSDRRLARFRRIVGPGVCTTLAPAAITRLRGVSWGLPAGRPPGDCLQAPVKWYGLPVLDRRLLETAHRLRLPAYAFTIDDEDEMERILDLGVDGIMSDRPTLLKEVLVRRGQWA